ncbi:MAG: RNA polymerase sigma factor region1.1 domain-containing protein [Muricoprocola sp.]
MDIQTFQKKLTEVCLLAKEHEQVLTSEQVQNSFADMNLDQAQFQEIYKYLKTQGIRVSGAEFEENVSSQQISEEEKKAQNEAKGSGHLKDIENPCLTDKDRTYLQSYEESLKENEANLSHYMFEAARMTAELYRDGMSLPDLIQEANVALLMILAEEGTQQRSSEDLLQALKKGIKDAVNQQDEQNFGDDYLVSKVQRLDSVLKELTDGEEGELKFSVEELAIMLDMDIDEMKDVIRLTGDL